MNSYLIVVALAMFFSAGLVYIGSMGEIGFLPEDSKTIIIWQFAIGMGCLAFHYIRILNREE